tara:strand:+ start:84 stop:368 length:285 start_codon:yes stop_codon:yes gene_type:complete
MRTTSIRASFILFLGLLVSGCSSIPQEAFQQPADNALITDAFVQQMEAGTTTRDQEQNFIRAQRKAWHAQNFALNDVPLPGDLAPVDSGSTNGE